MGMQITGQGGELLQVDARHRAARMSLRPLAALGAFRMEALSGAIAATQAADATLFSFRNPDPSKKIVLHELKAGIVVDGSITTSVLMEIEAIVARQWSVADSGQTAIATPNKADAALAISIADIRIAATAAITAGTRALDNQGFGMLFCISGTTAPVVPLQMSELYRALGGVEHPQVYAQNEGFIVRNHLTGPATGTYHLCVSATWSEVAAFDNTGL